MADRTKLIIIPFHPADQAKVKKIITEGLGEHWGKIDPNKNPDLLDIARYYQSEIFLVAWLEDEIVGAGALITRSDRVAEIVRVSVATHCRRQGIGHSILDVLIMHAQDKGYQNIILETTETWNGVIDFYLSYGFQTTHYDQGNVYLKLNLQ